MFSGERNVKYKELKKREETMDGTSVEIVNLLLSPSGGTLPFYKVGMLVVSVGVGVTRGFSSHIG